MTATPINEPEARALADAINQISSSQPATDASKLIELALARAPEQPIVLNAVAGHMYRIGNANGARELYQRALAIDPASKVLWLNLAAACRTMHDTSAEAAALDKALAIEPRYVLALLQKGDLMERLGNPKAAATAYGDALASQASGAPVPKGADAALRHAADVVRANAADLEAFIAQEVAAVRSKSGSADQGRFDACLEVFLGKRRVYASLPKGFLFPYLPAIEFLPRDDFPWLEPLEAATDYIAAEAAAVLRDSTGEFRPYVEFAPGTPLDQWAPLNHSTSWSVYSFWHDSKPLEEHIARCPKTAAAISALPLCDIPGYAPSAYFSVLKPHTHLPAHTGTTNSRCLVHLPLIIPDGCRFRVGSQTRAWQRGKAWVFDDTIEHEAWNDSDAIRIILICDIWNPLLSIAERDLVRSFNVAIGRYYGEDAPTLGSR